MADTKGWPKVGPIVEMDRFVAETREFCVDRVVPRHLIAQAPGVGVNSALSSFIDHETSNMILTLHTHILGLDGKCELKTTMTEEVPLTWWDHIKMRFFEEWASFAKWPLKPIGRYLKNRWPARYRTIEVQVLKKETRLCPHCTDKWPENKRVHLEWLVRKDEQ